MIDYWKLIKFLTIIWHFYVYYINKFLFFQGLERHLLGSHGLVTSSMQEAANKGKDAGRCPACGRVSIKQMNKLKKNE